MTALNAFTNSTTATTGPFTVHGLDHKALAANGIDSADALIDFMLRMGAEVSADTAGPCIGVTGWFGNVGYTALMTN